LSTAPSRQRSKARNRIVAPIQKPPSSTQGICLVGRFRAEPQALSPKPWGALEFTPGLTRPAPNMPGLGGMMANGIICGAGRVATGLTLSLDLDQAGRHANVVDVAEHVLEGLQLVDKMLALALVEERRHKLALIAQLL